MSAISSGVEGIKGILSMHSDSCSSRSCLMNLLSLVLGRPGPKEKGCTG